MSVQHRALHSTTVSSRGALRWQKGHPWIFRSDVVEPPAAEPGAVRVVDQNGRPLGVALYSPRSEIALRLLDREPNATLDVSWWTARLGAAALRRSGLTGQTNAFRLVHGEGDGIPSLVVDRYDRWLVAQFNSAGLEHFRGEIVQALIAVTGADGILARNDASLRTREGLERETVLLHGDVPREIEVNEHGVRYLAAPWTGQKTGAFLDQREARRLVGSIARGRTLDCFSYHGSFALHLATGASSVTALDSSGAALERARANAGLNGFSHIDFVETDVFDYLKNAERARERFDVVVLDPPAFAKNKAALEAALRGYHEINVRAMRLLGEHGMLFTASCSFHLSKARFLDMLERAAQDSGRRIALRQFVTQSADHPEILTIPETGYIKGALLEAIDD